MMLFKLVPFFISCLFISCAAAAFIEPTEELESAPTFEEMFVNYSKGQELEKYTVLLEWDRHLSFVITPQGAKPGELRTWFNIEPNQFVEGRYGDKIVDLGPAFPGYSAVLVRKEYPFSPMKRSKIMKKEYVDRIAPIIMKKYEEQQKGPQTSAISDTAKGPSIGSTSAPPKRFGFLRSREEGEDGKDGRSKQQRIRRLEQEGL